MSNWMIGPDPSVVRSRKGGFGSWQAWEEFDQPPGSALPASVAYQNQFNSHEWLTTAPMPVGHRYGYLHLWAASGSPGAWVWKGLENILGVTYATWYDGPGYNRGVEILYRAAVRNSTVGVNHHRSPRLNVLSTNGAFGMRHLAATTEAVMVQKDNSGGNESLSDERGGSFDWASQKWVWTRLRVVRYRVWMKSWADTVPEPSGWMFENYDTTALTNEPLTDYICRQANWHEDPHVYIANYAARLLGYDRELLIQYDFPMNTQTFNPPPSSVTQLDFTVEKTKYIEVYLRRTDDTHSLCFLFDTDGSIQAQKKDGGTTTLDITGEDFISEGQTYRVEIELNGKVIKLRVDGTEVFNLENTYNISTVGGKIIHNYVTNDIMLKVYS